MRTFVSGPWRFAMLAFLLVSSGRADAQTTVAVDGGGSTADSPVTQLLLVELPESFLVGRPTSVVVKPYDAEGRVVANYAGTVRITSSDSAAALPDAHTFGASDVDGYVFQVTFQTLGRHSLRVEDLGDSTLKSERTGLLVEKGILPTISNTANTWAALGVPYVYNARGAIDVESGSRPLHFETCGVPPGFRVDAQSGTVSWRPETVGFAEICVKASNEFGGSFFLFKVTVVERAERPVTTHITAAPTAGTAPLVVGFDGSGSRAGDNALPLLFQWSFGDGSPLVTGTKLEHAFRMPGSYPTQLRVWDIYGNSGTAEASIAVSDAQYRVPPRARIIASAVRGRDLLEVELECDCSEGSAPLASRRWDLGNGTTTSSTQVKVKYGPGRYHVNLLVVDEFGLPAWDSVEILVTRGDEVPPECAAGVDVPFGPAPRPATWTARSASASGGPTTVSWTFENGQTSGAARLERQLVAPRWYEGTLKVQDEGGLTCTARRLAAALGAHDSSVPPFVVTQPQQVARCGSSYKYAERTQARALGTGPVQWSATQGPEGFSIQPDTGEVNWKPLPSQRGPHRVVLRAQSAAGSAVQDFMVNVECPEELDFDTSCGCGSGAEALPLGGLLFGLWAVRRRRV